MQFSQGAKRNFEKTKVFGLTFTRTPFDKVRWDRNRSSSHLRGQSIQFVPGESGREHINQNRDIVGQFKRMEFDMIPHH
jgi:hypothetical protein